MRTEDWQRIELNDAIRKSQPYVVSCPVGASQLLLVMGDVYEVEAGDIIQVRTDGVVLKNGVPAERRT